MVPNGWSLIKLKDIGKCITGLTYSPKNVVDKGLLVLRSSNVQDSKLSFNDNVYVDLEVDNESKTRLGDILLCVRNGSKNLIGKSAFIDKGSEQLAHGAFMSLFRSNETPDYSFQLFQSSKFFRQVNQNLGATINSINSGNLYQFKFAYPPFEERKKIAKILSTWDKAIGTTERLIDNSKQQKKALMQQLITGKKRFAGYTKDWKQIQLGDIGKCITGLTYKPSDTADEGMLVLRSSNIQDSKLAFDDNVFVNTDLKVKSKTQENDILVCVRNGSKHLIGKSTLIQGIAVGQAHGAFMTLFRGKYPLYVSQLLQSDEFFRQVNMNLGATINSINTSDLHKFKFSIPTDENEIDAISSCLSNAEKEIEALKQQLADLKQEKKALMQQLLTGKRRVKIDDKEVA